MSDPETLAHQAAELRQQAEASDQAHPTASPNDLTPLSPEETQRTLHELRVHQIELEMQNEELRQAQAELAAARTRYFDLYNLAPVGYLTVSEPGVIQETNLTAANLLGVVRSALVHRPLSQFILKEDQDIYYQLRQQIFATGTPQAGELRMVTKDGSPFWARLQGTLALDEGVPPVARLVLSDITERKQAEAALRESEGRYRVLFDRANDGIFLLSADGELITVNESFARMHGYRSPAMLPRHLKDLDTPASSQLAPERMRRLLAGEALTFEVEHYHQDGHVFPLEVSASLISVGGHTFIQCFHRDITRRKQAEAERAKLESQFHQAQKLELVGRLAGGVAHDFNNMIGAILATVEMAMDQVDPAQPLFADLVEIRKAARRSADLTRQLLTFARREVVVPQVLDLNVAMEDLLKMLRRLIGEDINLAWLPATGLGPVKVDPTQIHQILANLCVNARDAISQPAPPNAAPPPAGWVGKITIATGNAIFDETYCGEHPGFVPGEYVLLTVSDNGCGMDPETLAHIFEPFFTTKGIGEGTGLGLATVYGIVKQNHGFIQVHSAPGQGTTFKIYLPRHASQVPATRPETAGEPRLSTGETVLLVEDEPVMLDIARRVLERLGYTVLAARTPGEALRLAGASGRELHLLLADVVLPEMNGWELSRRLVSLHPKLKCLFMSGYTANDIALHGVLNQELHFIPKPFSVNDLAAKVREVLER